MKEQTSPEKVNNLQNDWLTISWLNGGGPTKYRWWDCQYMLYGTRSGGERKKCVDRKK